jgi:hypothetical protein
VERKVNWRYVVGTFQVRIPVTTREVMLPPEENTLAIMKWRLQAMSPTNRWYPVLQRYVGYVSARVAGLGGNPDAIPPSLAGVPLPGRGGEDGTAGRLPCCFHGPLVFAIVAFLVLALVTLRLSGWGVPGPWSWQEIVAAALVVLGAAAELVALARSLDPRDEEPAHHARTVRWFLAGALVVAVAFVFALVAGI